MNREKMLIKGYLLKKYKRTGLICFMLSSIIAIYFIINQSFVFIREANVKLAEEKNGSWHFNCRYLNLDQVQEIKEEIEEGLVGCEWMLGEEQNALLLYRDSHYREMDSSIGTLIEGKLPQKKNEAAVTNDYLSEHNLKLGDEFTVSYIKVDYEMGKEIYSDTCVFVVTGILENFDYITEQPIIFVSPELVDQYKNKISTENTLVKCVEDKNIQENIKNIILNIPQNIKIQYNDELLYALDDNAAYRRVNQIINVIIYIVSVILLYNILYFDFLEKKKDLGILTCLGFTRSEMAKVLSGYIIAVLLICVPIGIALGYFLNAILYKKIILLFLGTEAKNYFFADKYLSWDVLVKGFLFLGLSIIPSIIKPFIDLKKISPMNIILSQNKSDFVKFQWWIKYVVRNKNKIQEYGIKNVARNRKRTRITLIVLILSANAISIIFLINGIGKPSTEWIKAYIPGDAQIQVDDVGKTYHLYENDIVEKIRETSGISDLEAMQINNSFWTYVDKERIIQNNVLDEMITDEMISANTEFVENKEMVAISTTIYSTNNIEKHTSSRKKTGAIIEKKLQNIMGYQIGDNILLILQGEDGDRVSKHVKIIDVVDEIDINNENGQCLLNIIIDDNTMQEFQNKKLYNRIDVWFENAEDVRTYNTLKNMAEINEIGTIISFEERAEIYLEEEKNREQILFFVISILICIATFNVFNNLFNNMMNRKEEFTMLNLIGFSKGEIYNIAICEGLCYSLVSSIVCVGIQIIVTILSLLFEFAEMSIKIWEIWILIDISLIIVCILFSGFIIRYLWR